MPDTYLCAHCGSTNLMARCDDWQCLACGNRTDMLGNARPKEPVFVAENPHNRRPM
jgi:DNA-directed RNA polymerase subunit RPC12/RpoP